jgi:phenylalanyl-tRNA synthetase beta chain
MKFTLDWLKEHLETKASADEISIALTTVGLEVESVADQGKALEKFVVAKIVSAEKHPNADKLQVCKVDAGTGELLNVVCGAPNARAGLKSVFAFPGTYIPGSDFTLTKGNIRGAESNGMLCSGRELQLSDDHNGIIELPEDAPIGGRFIDVAGINGVVYDIAITPNRGDCTGVHGVARDLAAFGLGTLKNIKIAAVPSTAGTGPIAVALRFGANEPEACRMFGGRLITGVKNGPSPDWLQARLRAIGLRPINALVDITNFITYDRARPLHVFDADKLTGTVHARMAKVGESLKALDGKTYALDESLCVIADDSGPLGLAGIIGGEATGSSEATTSVFIESAWFEPTYVATAGRKTGINSDARYRFERTVDPESVRSGLELATKMVLELCGGTVHEPVIAGHIGSPRTAIEFPTSEVKRLTGLDVPVAEMTSILQRLGFEIGGFGPFFGVVAPSWRPDVAQKADIVEEIMRMVGVDKVPVTPLPRLANVAKRMLTPMQNRRRLVRRALAVRGLDEAVTWSFISEPEASRFGGGAPELKLANPIAAEMTDMRPSLLPGLLSAARRNANRGFADLALFEVGQVFHSATPEGQRSFASGIRTGTAGPAGSGRHWRAPAAKVDVFDAKADLAAALDAVGLDIDKVQLVAEPASWSHPGRGGRLQLGPKVIIGWFGEIHPALLGELDLAGPVVAFEIDLDAVPEPRRKTTRAKPALDLVDLLPVSRDFAFVLDRDVPAATVLRAARNADKTLITSVEVFDVFEGTHVGEGKKSMAIAVTVQPRDKTLTDEEIDKISAAIVAAVGKATGGILRA